MNNPVVEPVQTITQLIALLPNLFMYFIPGFVYIKTYRRFSDSSTDSFESTAISSIAISYCISLLAGMKPDIVDNTRSLLMIAFAFLAALLLAKIRTLGIVNKIFKRVSKKTGNPNIWRDTLDRNLGTRIRCFTTYNFEKVIIEGDVLYYQACEDGECNIALEKYEVKYLQGNKHFYNGNQIIHINTRNIDGLEVACGRKKGNSIKTIVECYSEKKGITLRFAIFLTPNALKQGEISDTEMISDGIRKAYWEQQQIFYPGIQEATALLSEGRDFSSALTEIYGKFKIKFIVHRKEKTFIHQCDPDRVLHELIDA